MDSTKTGPTDVAAEHVGAAGGRSTGEPLELPGTDQCGAGNRDEVEAKKRRATKRPPVLKRICRWIKSRMTPPSVIHEKQFLDYQRDLRAGATHVLNEAMLVLDIIDVKTQSLLSYIAVSLAALVFLITSLPSIPNIRPVFLPDQYFSAVLLLLIIALLGASVLCLSCLNIVGAHTIQSLASKKKPSPDEYECFIVKVTLGRRSRYLVAHRISIVTAIATFVLFMLILINAMGAAPLKPAVPPSAESTADVGVPSKTAGTADSTPTTLGPKATGAPSGDAGPETPASADSVTSAATREAADSARTSGPAKKPNGEHHDTSK